MTTPIRPLPPRAWLTTGVTLVLSAGAWLSPTHSASVQGGPLPTAADQTTVVAEGQQTLGFRIASVAFATSVGRPLPAACDCADTSSDGAGANADAAAMGHASSAASSRISGATANAEAGTMPEEPMPQKPSGRTAAEASASSGEAHAEAHAEAKEKAKSFLEHLVDAFKSLVDADD